MKDENKLVAKKRERLAVLARRHGALYFIYVGKPRTLASIGGEQVRLNGLEKLERARGKLKVRGKVLLRERHSQKLVRVSMRDLEIAPKA